MIFGLIVLTAAAILVYGAGYVTDRIIRPETRNRQKTIAVLKIVGFGFVVLGMLIIMEII